MIVVLGLILIACSSKKEETTGNERIISEVTGNAAQIVDTNQETVKTVVLDCSNKAEIVDKIQKIQQKVDEYNKEINELNTKLVLYIKTNDDTGIKQIRYQVEKAIRMQDVAKQNVEFLNSKLEGCK